TQVTDYYPFGLEIKEINASDNLQLYNSKELQDDAKLWWYDYGARFYDPVIGRWHSVDPMAEKHPETNPYHYCFNNPINWIDPFGYDTLNVCLPQDRTQAGTMTLTANGQDVELEGGNEVLGKGTTNGGQNPTRDPCERNGDTPTGEATVTTILDRDPDGTFANTDGTPVQDSEGEPGGQLVAQGRYFILLNPESGDLQLSERSELGIHGGGTVLGENALQGQQNLVGTRGCLRVTNQNAAQIGAQALDANKNNRVFRVIIEEE
ncbi:MAG: RHS repeat-associated core domain-containing protein, partial [Bacteroidales bacterium]|nr:RHS repeat-associated core domain-containing protein [Bacteroidales bacterium]